MHLLVYSLLLGLSLLVICCRAQLQVPNSSTFQVGVVLDLETAVGRIGWTGLKLALKDFYSVNSNYTTRLQLHVRDSREQLTDAAAAALDLLKDVKVDAILGPQKSAQASFVIDLGNKSKVPIISFSATSPALHPRTPYFVQTAVSDAVQVNAIAAIVQHFQWRQVVALYEDSDYGNGMIPYLSDGLQDVNARISYRSVIPSSATDDFLLQELYKMKTMQTRIFVVQVSHSLGARLFPRAMEAGMMDQGYAWIVASGLTDLLSSLDPHIIETSMQGVLGVKPLIPRSSKLSTIAARWKREFQVDSNITNAELSLRGLWAYDTLWALAMAAERVGVRESAADNTTHVLNSINLLSTQISETGPKLLEALSQITFDGLSGKFSLINGQLESPSFQILNIIGKGEREVGIWTKSDGIVKSKFNSIIFPGDSLLVPKGWEFPVGGKKLTIGVPVTPGYTGFIVVDKDPQTNGLRVSGCYIDLFEAVVAKLPYAVPHEFVPFQNPDGSMAGTYDELSYQVFLKKYDAVVGDMTITTNRSRYVDFTQPFAAGGVMAVVPITYDNSNSKWVFLKPLKEELWLTAIALFVFTGFGLWILEHRFNSAYRGPPSQHTGMIFYFPFMSLVFAQRERIVTNLGRLVVVVWLFVVLVLNSTYTASLSARLTVQSFQPAVINVTQLISTGANVGCHKRSFIVDLLQGMGFDKSKIKTYESPEDCDAALSKGSAKGGISALFAVSPFADLFVSHYCDKYTTVGPTTATEGFAYIFPKGSPLVADISRAVIEVRESGRASQIESQCSKDPPCSRHDGKNTSTGVSLESFQALFGITGGITATCLVIFLARYLYENRDSVRRISRSNTTSWLKICTMYRLFDQKDPKSFRTSKAEENGESPSTSPNLHVHNYCPGTVVPISIDEVTVNVELSISPTEELTTAEVPSQPHLLPG